MTVNDLIKKLNDFPLDATVWVSGQEEFIVASENIQNEKIVSFIPE